MLQVPEGNLATLRVSADPWALNGPRGLVKQPQIMKSIMMACMRDTLIPPNLSHMDFPDGPAAFHRCRTTYSRTTKSPSPNELMDPEISMKNHQIFTHCFLGSGPAIFPDTDISSCACIVLLCETSSSSHLFEWRHQSDEVLRIHSSSPNEATDMPPRSNESL